MREQKYHLYISANEHSEIIKNLIRLKNKLQSEGRYTDAVDDLIIKFSSAKMKSIQIKPKARANFNGKLSLFLWCKVLFNLSEQTIYTPIVVKRSNLVREHPKTCQKNR